MAAAGAYANPPSFSATGIRRPQALAAEILREHSPLHDLVAGELTDPIRQVLDVAATTDDDQLAARSAATALNDLLLSEAAAQRPANAAQGLADLYDAMCAAAPEWLPPGRPNLVCRGQRRRLWQAVHTFVCGGNQIEVDAVTNRVTSVKYPFRSTRHPAAVEGTERAARKWLADHGTNLHGWVHERAEIIDHGSSITTELVWRYAADGVELPGLIHLSMDADGVPVSLLHIERPLQVTIEPTVTLNNAVAAARAYAHQPSAEAGPARLRVWFDQEGRQRLLWTFGLRHKEYVAAVQVDAHTGQVVHAISPGGCEDCDEQVAQFTRDLQSLQRVELISASELGTGRLIAVHAGAGVAVAAFGPQSLRLAEVRTALAESVQPVAVKPGSFSGWWLALHTTAEPAVYYARFAPSGGLLIDHRLPGDAKHVPSGAWPPEGAQPIDLAAHLPVDLTRSLYESAGVDCGDLPGSRPAGRRSPFWWLAPIVVSLAAAAVVHHLRRNPANSPIA